MNLPNSINKNLAVITAIVVAVLIFAAPMEASAAELNVPSTLVNVIVQDGTDSYFLTTLSNVPDGYPPLTNGTYSGWCIDHNVTMIRNETFEAQLYSSLTPPQGIWSNASWDKVNYVLNHKQGNATDIQYAIWNFINNTTNFTQTLTPAAIAMIADAQANGTNFVPSTGQTVAIIVFPQVIIPGSGPFQDSIIEIIYPQIPEFPTIAVPLIFGLAVITAAIVSSKKRTNTKPNKPRLAGTKI